jgi:hypothetical protein
MAPEQLLGTPASVASDVYALAAVAYELLTGRRPFNPDTPNPIAAIPQLMTLQRSGEIVPPQQLRPSVSAAAQAIVLRGLAFDPTARLADAREFGDTLAQALVDAGESTEAAVTLVAPAAPQSSASLAPIAPTAAPQPPERRRHWLVAVAATAAIGAVAGVVFLALSRSSPAVPPTVEKQAMSGPSHLAEESTLTYSVTLQRDPTRFPGQRAIRLTGDPVFSAGDRVRLAFTSRQGGHLYIFNESPRRTDGPGSVNVLFPSPTSNGGSAELRRGQAVAIPGVGDGFVFDEEEGVERLWIIWSRARQPRLESMQRWANPDDRGEIKDAADVEAFHAFRQAHASPAPDTAVDDVAEATTLSARADVFVRLVKLAHH